MSNDLDKGLQNLRAYAESCCVDLVFVRGELNMEMSVSRGVLAEKRAKIAIHPSKEKRNVG